MGPREIYIIFTFCIVKKLNHLNSLELHCQQDFVTVCTCCCIPKIDTTALKRKLILPIFPELSQA